MASSDMSQDEINAFVRHMFGHQSTLEFLPVSVSAIPHARRLQQGYVATDQLGRFYHAYPEGERDSLDDGYFETARFFVATPANSWTLKEGEEAKESAQLPRPGEELTLYVTNGTRVVTAVSSVPERRDASAQVVLEVALRLPSNATKFARFVAQEHARLRLASSSQV